MIHFDNVSKRYKKNLSLQDIDLTIRKGEFVSITGQSGAGKTTLMKLIIAEEEPTDGIVSFDNMNVQDLRGAGISHLRRRIGTIFQDFKLLSNKTAYENVAFAMEAAGRPEHEIKTDVPYALELVNMADKAFLFPRQLSGGERQRLAIARALVNQPDVILADEPTGNLDPRSTYDVIEILTKVNDLGTTVVLSTHDASVVDSLDRRVVTLHNGSIIGDSENGSYKQ